MPSPTPRPRRPRTTPVTTQRIPADAVPGAAVQPAAVSPGPPPAAAPSIVPTPRAATPPATPPVARLSDVVPAPVSTRPVPAVTYTLPADATIRTSGDAAATAVGDYLAAVLRRSTGYALPVTSGDPAGLTRGGICLLLSGADPSVGTEGYELDVSADRVVIRAHTAAGLFYGMQTLRQLLPASVESAHMQPGPWIVPGGRIVDHPRFAYRGAMLDVSRHFFAVADVKHYLDELALYKVNHLHLHLTDDQGWRIAIDSWPRLAEIGGATEVDGGPGGYYTKAQYQEIVAHAAARHITIVPEIDMPGHTNAALTAYGALARDGVTPPAYTGTDVGFSALRVDGDLSYAFIDDVLGELAAITPGPYLHIGGDEVFTMSPADYATFMNRVQPIVTAKGKAVVGWHQVAPADHEADRVLQFWGTSPADPKVVDAVRRGARVILSPGNHTYLDMRYTDQTPLGKDWAGLVEVREAYDWDPGSYLDGVPAAAVLGVEAPLWTETISTMGQVEFMTFPRLPAIAELGWSPAASHDWEGFRRRLGTHGPRWTAAGIAFYPSPQVPWVSAPVDVPATPTTAPAVAATMVPVPEGVPAGSPTRVVGSVADTQRHGDLRESGSAGGVRQPPESSSSAPSGTASASRSSSQPSGR